MNTSIDKFEILSRQIDAACELHNTSSYIESLTLATSSSQLSNEILKSSNSESERDLVYEIVRMNDEVHGNQSPKKSAVLNRIFHIRNQLKHHNSNDSMELTGDFELESFIAINEAISNFKLLGQYKTALMREFEDKTNSLG